MSPLIRAALGGVLLCGLAWCGPSARAQVVIRERVAVHPDADATGGGPGPAPAGAWPGNIRGKGTLRIWTSGGVLYDQPLSALAATLTTTKGRTHTVSLAAPQTGSREVCEPDELNPEWTACTERGYGDGAPTELQLDADEDLGTLRLTGPGVDRSFLLGIQPPPYGHWNELEATLNCGWHYFAWGPYHPGDCACMVGQTGLAHGRVGFKWSFVPDPPDLLRVEAVSDTVLYHPGMPFWSKLTATAVYADGTLAPLAEGTPLTFAVGSSTYSSVLVDRWRWYGWETEQRGPSVTLGYGDPERHVVFVAGPDPGGGEPSSAEGPVCDTAVGVTVSGGGLGGSTAVVIRGTSTATQPDTLVVSASPSTIQHGEESVITAAMQTADGCDVRPNALPNSTQMAVGVLTAYYGDLEYEGERAPVFFGVPYGDLRAGRVRFIADGAPCDSALVPIRVEGAGLVGSTVVAVVGDSAGAGAMAFGPDVPQASASCPPEGECACPDAIDLIESKQSIIDWHLQNCSDFQTLSNPPQAVEESYERNLALYLSQFYPGGLGWGSVPGYTAADPEGVDGYGMWAFEAELGVGGWTYTELRDYTHLIVEAKLTNQGYAIGDYYDFVQMRRHVDFLADEYQRMAQAAPSDYIQAGRPVLVVMSQNRREDDEGWRFSDIWERDGGVIENYHQRLLDHATARGVLVVHGRVARVPLPGEDYRNAIFRAMNEVPFLDHPNPFLGALLRWFSEPDLMNLTFPSILPLRFDCDARDDLPEHRSPPGSGS